MSIQQVLIDSLNTCRAIVPFDTGNYARRGIRGYIINQNEFVIVFDGFLVPYITPLEEGSKFYKGAKGHISRDCTKAVADIVKGRMEQKDLIVNAEVSAERIKSNPASNKRFLESIRR